MVQNERIDSILNNYYPNVRVFLGDIIGQRLTIQDYEDGVLTSNLLNDVRKLADEKLDELGNYDIDVDEKSLDIDLYRLDQALCHGEDSSEKEYCRGFNHIFSDIYLKQCKDADDKILELLAEVKACEFLLLNHFSHIVRLEKEPDKYNIEFTAQRNGKNYAIKVVRLVSAKHIENHCNEYEINFLKDWLAGDIDNLIHQHYPKIKQYFQRRIGVWNVILFISSGRDYFGHHRHEKKVYCLEVPSIIEVARQEWQTLKKAKDSHKYLSHLVLTTGKNPWNIIAYPS